MPAVKSNNGLKDELNVVNESRNLRGQSKRIFWQTSINEQRPKLRVCNKWQIYYWLTGHRCGCKYHYTRVLASALASSGGRYSVLRNWNPISSKTKHEMGQLYRSRRTNRKTKAICSKYCSEFMGP